jgi:hypothetical protein
VLDIIEGELLQDEWSLLKLRFGKEDQLQVVGWNGLRGNSRKYILKCSVCSSDAEMFKNGYFLSAKGHLTRDIVPCGCGVKYKWTEDQYKLRLKRIGETKGFQLIGWRDGFSTVKDTICVMQCDKLDHGTAYSVLSWVLDTRQKNFGCQQCKSEAVKKSRQKDDDYMIKTFMDTGAYHPDTVFTRSLRKDSYGWMKYWYMYCPDCDTIGEGHVVGIYQGARSCECSNRRQQQAYINLIKDVDEIIAIKYGIAIYSENRIKTQQTNCIYEMENYGVWKFDSVANCKAAERTCSTTLERNLLTKEEMKDGHTETTYPGNIERIIEIYESYGGIRCQ